MILEVGFYALSALFTVASLLPLVNDQYWIFRVVDFGRIQLVFLGAALVLSGFLLMEGNGISFWTTQSVNVVVIVNHLYLLLPYTRLYDLVRAKRSPSSSNVVSVLSVNVYQFNENYQQLIDLVRKVDPDILLTMESNKAWENGISELEEEFGAYKKVAQENTYGMHFYTQLKVHNIKVNYFMADDIPSLEVALETKNGGTRFKLFGVHPPPPSPTEEPTSKERDGELLSVAKRVKSCSEPVVVIGDFNNVAWSRSSRLFKKTSGLVDPRVGRGFIPTFHTKYWFLRFPIDLMFHSSEVIIEEIKTLEHIGSDHFPLFCRFGFAEGKSQDHKDEEELEAHEASAVDEMIAQGKEESGNRPAIAEE